MPRLPTITDFIGQFCCYVSGFLNEGLGVSDVYRAMFSPAYNIRPASSSLCYYLAKLARPLQHDTVTTWFQTSNLIQSNNTAVAKNKTQKYRNGLANF